MENLDIIILSTIITTLFVVFVITMWRELNAVSKNPPDYSKETGPRANMINFIGSLFDLEASSKMSPLDKAKMYRVIKRTIADMESDGVYFPKEIKEELKQKRNELVCHYSDLPSVMSYSKKDNDYDKGYN